MLRTSPKHQVSRCSVLLTYCLAELSACLRRWSWRWMHDRGCRFLVFKNTQQHAESRLCVNISKHILNIYENWRSWKKYLIFKYLRDFFGKKFLSKYSLSFVKILTFFCQNTHFLLSKYSPCQKNTGFFVKTLTSLAHNWVYFVKILVSATRLQ